MREETFFDYPVFDNIKQIIYYSVESKIHWYNIYRIFKWS